MGRFGSVITKCTPLIFPSSLFLHSSSLPSLQAITVATASFSSSLQARSATTATFSSSLQGHHRCRPDLLPSLPSFPLFKTRSLASNCEVAVGAFSFPTMNFGSSPDQSATGKTLDHAAAAHLRHTAMLERLSNRKQSAAPRSNSNDSFESTNSFLSGFSQSKLSIDSDLSRCSSKPDLERVSASISDLENLVAQNSYFLPSYELRSCLKSISDLKQSIENVSSQIVPKKRFAFKNKKASSTPTPNEVSLPAESPKPSFVVSHLPGFRDMENELLVKDFKGLEMGEFSISNLSSCEVRLTGCLRALFVNRLRNCRVFMGPVLGSVLIEEVEGCMLVLASHQIRIHHAKGSDFYLRVRSRPIIEDCSAVRFAPYCLSYDGIEKDLKESNLDEETGNCANVDDFRWLKAVQSPNWSVLPENERNDRITISNLDK